MLDWRLGRCSGVYEGEGARARRAPDHTPATPDQSDARARFPDQRPCPFPFGRAAKRANGASALTCEFCCSAHCQQFGLWCSWACFARATKSDFPGNCPPPRLPYKQRPPARLHHSSTAQLHSSASSTHTTPFLYITHNNYGSHQADRPQVHWWQGSS